jgi:hypothetical protein
LRFFGCCEEVRKSASAASRLWSSQVIELGTNEIH